MKLKRLELQGYKTFAGRTVFEFDSGITAIVGPNGSGKSNVADALRWVLGEQSYSTLRGKSTTDMIFAGSQDRARAGMAQAILTLDNSDGWLPIDYNEVVIGRRAFRSGENEYLLNGQKVRLRDVQELLATSGLAERTYTIIGQGLVDQALSLRAEERRALFEEAAGVSHYQTKRAATLRRLQETQRNLERVHDILSEIRPRLGGLKRQANRAATYEQVQADLRHLLRLWYGYQWEAKKEALRRQRQVTADAEAEWKESRARLASHHESTEKQRRHLAGLQRQLAQRQQEREKLREEREQARRRVAILHERATFLTRQLAEIEGELPRLRQQQAAADEELGAALEQLEKAQDNLADHEKELLSFNQSFREQQAEIDRAAREVASLEQALREGQRQHSQAEGQLSQLTERLQEQRHADGEAEALQGAKSQGDRLSQVAASAQARLEELNQQRSAVQAEQQLVRRQLKEARRAQGEHSQRVNQLNKEVAGLETRCEMFDQIRQRDAVSRADIPVLGRLAGLVDIPAEHREAVEAALGARLATLVLPDGATLWQLLRQNDSATSLHALAAADARPAPSISTPQVAGVFGWAGDLVTAKHAPDAVVALLLGQVLLVTDREVAYDVAAALPPGSIAVAPDGFMVHAGGLVEINPRDPQRSILAREEAWRAATAELAEARNRAAALQAESNHQQQQIEEVQEALNDLDREERRLGRLVQESGQRYAQAQRDLDRARQQLEYLERQQALARQEAERLQERVRQTENSLREQQEEITRREAGLLAARARLETLPVAASEQERRTRRQDIETARTIVAGREAVVESRRATLSQIETQLRRQQERQQRVQNERLELDLDTAQSGAEALQKQIEQLDARLKPLQVDITARQAALEQVEDQAAATQRQTHDLETYYTQMKVAFSQHENSLEGLIERIKNDLGLVALSFDREQGGQSPLPIGDIVEQLPVVAALPGDIEETIQNYRGQLHRIGSINPEAPLEYEQTLERYEFLNQQVEDLQQTEKRLRRVIAELDELTSRAFAATVRRVDEIFGEMFTNLFGGGSARLVLTEPDDLTVSGVDIVARLPNRRQQRLGLLSGGERSLTAAALIFALLKVAPPPFSVLDEVDAMLDEANVTRFRGVLRDLAQHSQFIVITHNRGTVQAARTVYGISMGRDSASQVLSIRPEEYLHKK